ncbi:MAG: mandelate racemase/muconate lactonizing enzyme family protein [Verrucomicrobiota bacterium]
MKISATSLFFLPVDMRVPLKFGAQTLSSVTCARAKVSVTGTDGKSAEGWGETPLSVAWVWPSALDYEDRHQALKNFTLLLAREFEAFSESGHAFDISFRFIEDRLESLRQEFNANRPDGAGVPHLAALVCFSLFDIALHDAFARLHEVPVYQTYDREFLQPNLDRYLTSSASHVDFNQQHLSDHLVAQPSLQQPVWHLVGGLDPISEDELTGDEPDDGYPVLLRDWIQRDGLNCLKLKLRGNDYDWDIDRLLKIGEICRDLEVMWLTTDFNCTVTDPAYVCDILDQLKADDPVTYQKILYVEQPFPYDLEANQIDVRSVSARKPLFMDESAHDWRFVEMGRELGWTGVALKTCKSQTGALLSLAWAKAHGMTLMVQDLTNPMLAQVPHFLLAAHAGTIMGVESNGMQFYPDASLPEQEVHPNLYRRRNGQLDGSTLGSTGFGYRVDEIHRELPAPVYG